MELKKCFFRVFLSFRVKMEEVVIARPKEGNANFEELFIGAHEEEEEEDDYGFARDARNAAAIGLDIPGVDQPSYLNDEPENPFTTGPLPPPANPFTTGPAGLI
jgi:hypothetical protein